MKLSQLVYFDTVCKHMSITLAAKELYISQPAVSAAIRRLEEELEVSLFLRVNNRLYLTAEGEALLKSVKTILQEIRDLRQTVKSKEQEKKSITIGVPSTLYAAFFTALSRIREQFYCRYPGTRLHLHEIPVMQLEKMLHDNLLDFAVAFSDKNSFQGLCKEPVFMADIKLCVGAKNALAALDSASVENFRNNRSLTCFKEDDAFCRAISSWYGEQSEPERFLSPCAQVQTVETLLAQSDAVALLPPDVCRFSSAVTAVPLKRPFAVEIDLIWNGNNTFYAASVWLLNELMRLTAA